MDRRRGVWFWLVGLAALAVIALVVVLGMRGTLTPRRGPAGPAPAPPSFRTAPDFRLRGFDGRLTGLSDFPRKIVVLNFWASWCTPCKQEMPNLESVWREFNHRGVVVLGIDVLDDPDDAATFLRQFGITYPNVHDPERSRMIAYQVTALPTTFFIDRSRRIRARFVGGYVGASGREELRARILHLLNETSP